MNKSKDNRRGFPVLSCSSPLITVNIAVEGDLYNE